MADEIPWKECFLLGKEDCTEYFILLIFFCFGEMQGSDTGRDFACSFHSFCFLTNPCVLILVSLAVWNNDDDERAVISD